MPHSCRANRRRCRNFQCSLRILRSGSKPCLADGGFDAQLAYWRGPARRESCPCWTCRWIGLVSPWRGQAAPGGLCTRRLPRGAFAGGSRRWLCARGASAFMVLLTAFTVLLNRYSDGQEDVLIGTSSANRDRLEIENLIGLFVNPLLMRVRSVGQPHVPRIAGPRAPASCSMPSSTPKRRSKSSSKNCNRAGCRSISFTRTPSCSLPGCRTSN